MIEKDAKVYALVEDGGKQILIINVTDPSNPTLVGNFSTKYAAKISAIKMRGEIYACFADYG